MIRGRKLKAGSLRSVSKLLVLRFLADNFIILETNLLTSSNLRDCTILSVFYLCKEGKLSDSCDKATLGAILCKTTEGLVGVISAGPSNLEAPFEWPSRL